MQASICTWLAQDLSCISVLRVIQLYLERLGHYLPVRFVFGPTKLSMGVIEGGRDMGI